MGPLLLLVRHSQSQPNPARPASEWGLTDEGRRRCAELAARLATYSPELIVSSAESKAAETGALLAEHLAAPFQIAGGLHEHRRERSGWLAPDQFDQAIAELFERPTELVLGEETAAEAGARFAASVRAVLEQHAGQTIAIVAHGTVMTLFIAQHSPIDPLPFWKGLGMPAYAVLRLPDFQLIEVAPRL